MRYPYEITNYYQGKFFRNTAEISNYTKELLNEFSIPKDAKITYTLARTVKGILVTCIEIASGDDL